MSKIFRIYKFLYRLFVLLICLAGYECTQRVTGRNLVHDPEQAETQSIQGQRGVYLSKSDLYRLKKLLPLLPLQHLRPLRNIYEIARSTTTEEGVHLDFESLLQDDLDAYISQAIGDEQLQRFLYESRSVQPYDVASDDVNVDISEIPKDVGARNQTQGWEGCVRDYDMVMLPQTVEYRNMIILKLWDRLGLGVPNLPEVPPENPVARPLVDAIGKRPAGFWQGALHWVGAVDLCHITGVRYTWNASGMPERREFRGKYVRLDIPWILSNPNISTLWPFAIGVCAPDTCSDENIERYVSEENDIMLSYLLGGGIIPRNVTYVYSGQNPDFSTDTGAKVIVAVGAILAFLILVSTCYDGWGRHRVIEDKIRDQIKLKKTAVLTLKFIKRAENYLYDKPSLRDRIETGFSGFSLYSNIRRVYSNHFPREFHVPSVDGIRALTFLWLVKDMSRMFGLLYFETWTTYNLASSLSTYYDDWTDMTLISMPLNIAAFFYASGFVCVQMFYKAFHENSKKVTFWFVLRYFMHRFWSLMSTVLPLLMIYMFFYRYLIDGPIMSPDITDAEKCKKTWWLPFLLWHNLFKLDQQCFAFTYYYGVMWQLNLVSILVLLPLVILPAAGYLVTALMYIAHIVVLAIWQQRRFDGELTWFFDIQMTPWCQAGPYVIGMIFAMILKGSKKEKKWHWFPILLCWVLALAGILISVYAPWDQLKEEGRRWNTAGEVAFAVLSPQIFALGLGWITFACWKGYGGVVGKLLDWGVFAWMSRLMLPMTIFLGPVMQRHHLHRHKLFYITESHMSEVYFGNLIEIFIFGNLIAFLFTYPITRGVAAAADAKTRLETFVYARHPEILSGFTGNAEKDTEHMQNLIKQARRARKRATKQETDASKDQSSAKTQRLSNSNPGESVTEESERPFSYSPIPEKSGLRNVSGVDNVAHSSN